MLKEQLASELRQRQYNYGKVGKELIDSLTADQIIDSYIACSCCGEKQVDTDQLPQIIASVSDVTQFFALCSSSAKTKAHIANDIEGIIEELEQMGWKRE